MTENRQNRRLWGGGEKRIEKRTRNLLEVMARLIILIMVMVSQVLYIPKTYHVACFKHDNFTLCQSYLNKAITKKNERVT